MGSRPASLTPTYHHDVYPAISPTGGLKGAAQGLSVFVTGAGRGIGRAQALTFAQAGAKQVTLFSLIADELVEVEKAISNVTNGQTTVIKVTGDVTSEESVKAAFDAAGAVHVLVNNAGIMEPNLLLHESKVDDWWRTYEINVKGTYVAIREAIRRTLAAGTKLTIINTSSTGSFTVMAGLSSYTSTKSAINRITEAVHLEYKDKGIRAFAFNPGDIMTKLASDVLPKEILDKLKDTPELPAGYSLWLATQGDRATFLSGRYSSANWDVDELIGLKSEIEEKNLLLTKVVGQHVFSS